MLLPPACLPACLDTARGRGETDEDRFPCFRSLFRPFLHFLPYLEAILGCSVRGFGCGWMEVKRLRRGRIYESFCSSVAMPCLVWSLVRPPLHPLLVFPSLVTSFFLGNNTTGGKIYFCQFRPRPKPPSRVVIRHYFPPTQMIKVQADSTE